MRHHHRGYRSAMCLSGNNEVAGPRGGAATAILSGAALAGSSFVNRRPSFSPDLDSGLRGPSGEESWLIVSFQEGPLTHRGHSRGILLT